MALSRRASYSSRIYKARALRWRCHKHRDSFFRPAPLAGLILSLVRGGRPIEVTWVLFSASRERANVMIKHFKHGHFPYEGAVVKSVFESLKRSNPDLVLTHYRDDRHQDHRVLSDLAWNTFRDHFVLEYEIPKFDGDLGTPKCFVPLTSDVSLRKVEVP
jgi:LmbE family N-acetylglucosaminyl deacetylase